MVSRTENSGQTQGSKKGKEGGLHALSSPLEAGSSNFGVDYNHLKTF